MKKYFSLLLCVCLFINSLGQTSNKDSFFIVKGKVLHPQQDFWEFAITDFIGKRLVGVPIDKNGCFFQKVSITDPQDIHLLLNNDATIIFAVPGDTLDISWNEKDFATSFKITSLHPWRQKELDAVLEIDRKFKIGTRELNQNLHNSKVSDAEKFASIKTAFANEAATLAQYPMTINSRKIYADAYFKYLRFMHSARLLTQYSLSYADLLPREKIDRLGLSFKQNELNEEIFYQSPSYRTYLYNVIQSYKLFTSTITLGPNPSPKSNLTLNDCYLGMALLGSSQVIKDWFLCSVIESVFRQHDFTGAEEAYRQFSSQIKTESYKTYLQNFYTDVQRLRPGKEAPAFSLRDKDGKTVSLSDFKGKVVYLDFWGVYCGPCISAIKNTLPKVHEKYKGKDVVFVNICVDVEEAEWKEKLSKLPIDGINLLASGWTKNPVCQAYNINGIPHYALIDKEGKIVDNNGPLPHVLLSPQTNLLDKLLNR